MQKQLRTFFDADGKGRCKQEREREGERDGEQERHGGYLRIASYSALMMILFKGPVVNPSPRPLEKTWITTQHNTSQLTITTPLLDKTLIRKNNESHRTCNTLINPYYA